MIRAMIAMIGLLALGGCAADAPSTEQPAMYLSMADGGARLDPQAAASMISLYRQNNGLGVVVVDPESSSIDSDWPSRCMWGWMRRILPV